MRQCREKALPLHRISESSAVGSALRSGRRGRAFESPLSDKKRDSGLYVSAITSFFLLRFEGLLLLLSVLY